MLPARTPIHKAMSSPTHAYINGELQRVSFLHRVAGTTRRQLYKSDKDGNVYVFYSDSYHDEDDVESCNTNCLAYADSTTCRANGTPVAPRSLDQSFLKVVVGTGP